MSRPRFLADHDLDDAIVSGVLRREPDLEIRRVREVGMDRATDDAVLAFAANDQWIVVSHDVNSMTAAAHQRVAAGKPTCSLLLVRQQWAIRPTIDSLLLIWGESQAEEWHDVVAYLPV